ncbi:MAG: hypothetical protein BroJett014_04880 [Planctomycetota bacterium]|nr:hypothetical protein [Planctomycetota bacterium]GIK51515.1 MAG: hypothetical protein BroJett014_04880 [Planctomycetota bacterium]
MRTLADSGKFYILFTPPMVNPARGTLAVIVAEGEENDWFDLIGGYYLHTGCRYVPIIGRLLQTKQRNHYQLWPDGRIGHVGCRV